MIRTPQAVPWHATSSPDVLAELESTSKGLTSTEAADRLARYGPNQLKSAPPVSMWKLLLEEFSNPLILILLGAAVVLFVVAFVGDDPSQNIDAGLILGIVIINATLSFSQNRKAQQGIEALKRLAAPTAAVIRDGTDDCWRHTTWRSMNLL
ncbi:MAG: yloB [Dehalococcoidia bacterium]|nr:yloB [Dehalococcoidia bacterium]